MNMCRRINTIAVAFAAMLFVAGAAAQMAPAKPAAARPTPPSSDRDMSSLLDSATATESRELFALVTAAEETTLSSQMAGKIRKINFGLGDLVKAGDVVLEFDCEVDQAQLQTALAEYRGARETHLTKLKLQSLGAAGELEVTLAAAAADKAKSQVDFRESMLAYCKVSAPFSGRLVKLRVKAAESVSIGQPLVEMVNPATLKAQLYVPAAWVRWIRLGTALQVQTAEDGRWYRARVSKLNARVEGVNQTLELEARFEGPTQWLLPGMVGTVVFPTRPKP